MPLIYIYIYRRALFLALVAFIVGSVGLFSGFISSDLVSSAYATNTDFNINLNPSMSMEISSNTLSATLNPSSHDYDTNNLLITLGTNYVNGYNLYINSDSVNLTNSDYGDSNKYYINTLTGTATGTQADFPANFWGYRISSSDSGGDGSIISTTNFFPFTSGTLISSADTATSGKNVTLTFATKIDYTKPAGLYTNTFTFNAIVNPVTYSITYADNTGDTIGSMPSPNPQTGMISGGSATLSSTIPTRDGYTFKSWCLGTVSNSGTTCTGTEYSAGGSLPISSTVGPEVSVTINAVWEVACQSVIAGNMQDFDPCDNIAVGTSGTLTDSRDSKSYTVAKLADGKWWMMTNLNLGATTLTTDLTSSNTNLSSTVTASTFNGWKKTSGSPTYTAGEYIPVSGTDSTNGLPYGTLYNYCAASAGTICTDSNSDNASYDICPKGWRLPTGGSSGEFQALYNNASYNTNAKMRAPYTEGGAAFTLAGYFLYDPPTNQGYSGGYWSSTWNSSTGMHHLDLGTSSVYPARSDRRDSGNSIRCVLK